MNLQQLLLLFGFFSCTGYSLATPIVTPNLSPQSSCTNGAPVLSETWIGKDHNVKMEMLVCPGQDITKSSLARTIQARQTNVCGGAGCNRICFAPAGGGPDPNECHIIADALRYESQNTGALFQIGTGVNNTVSMTYRSCNTFFVNQDLGALIYCRTGWADVIDSTAVNCQATQNAHGGLCLAPNQSWFVQVQST